MERSAWTVQKTVTFAHEQKDYFLILCNTDHVLSLQAKWRRGSIMSACVYFLYLFIQFSWHTWFFNYTASLCHWELTSTARFFFIEQAHRSIWSFSSNAAWRCLLKVMKVFHFICSDSLRLSISSKLATFKSQVCFSYLNLPPAMCH